MCLFGFESTVLLIEQSELCAMEPHRSMRMRSDLLCSTAGVKNRKFYQHRCTTCSCWHGKTSFIVAKRGHYTSLSLSLSFPSSLDPLHLLSTLIILNALSYVEEHAFSPFSLAFSHLSCYFFEPSTLFIMAHPKL